MTIRVAAPDDIPAVLAVWEQARSAAAATDDTPSVVGALLEHDPGALLVAEADGAVVGTLIAAWDGWRGAMYRLAVLPPYRRRGVGGALVRAGHERLVALGAGRVGAIVGSDEPDAVGFWQALGYEPQPDLTRFVRNL